MIEFERLDGPSGIPVYYQRVPVRSVSIYWLVFVGSADDETVGNHGIYHWFEHIPSRGTRKYPGGYRDTEARLVRHGGAAGAETDYTSTAFYADVPRRVWTSALDILTDMIAQPLMRPEDVEAEREIIEQEIDEWHSSPHGEALCRLPGLLWPGHPLGHDQLGSVATLHSMNPELLRLAHQDGYARSRCVLFVAGDLDKSEVLEAVDEAVVNLPTTDLPARTAPVSYGDLPEWQGDVTTYVDTKHEDSSVYLLFPVPASSSIGDASVFWSVLESLVTAGDLGSPLNRIVREDSRLAYSPSFTSQTAFDGGYWGLEAQTNGDARLVIEKFWQVLRSPELLSKEWFSFVTDTIQGEFDMQVPSPGDFTEEAADRLAGYGHAWSNDEMLRRMLGVSRNDLVDYLQSLAPEMARTIVFRKDEN